MFSFLPTRSSCCETDINLVMFPIVDYNPIVITSSTPIGWYMLFPPDGSRDLPQLCYIDGVSTDFLGWSTQSIEDCTTSADKLQAGRCIAITAFVNDFTETASVESEGNGVTDNIITTSGRHVSPKIWKDREYTNRENFTVINPNLETYDPSIGILPAQIINCRSGYSMVRDQMVSHVGSDELFGTFLNTRIRITGTWVPSQIARHPTNTSDRTFLRDFIRFEEAGVNTYLLYLLPGAASCCDCRGMIRVKTRGGAITQTSGQTATVRKANGDCEYIEFNAAFVTEQDKITITTDAPLLDASYLTHPIYKG